MAHRHELKRRRIDSELDASLDSEDGRLKYWDDLRRLGQRYSWISLLESTLHLSGDVIECGVYRGRSLFMMGCAIAERSVSKNVHACDSFEGFPPDKVGPHDQAFFRSLNKLRSKFKLADDIPHRISRFSKHYNFPILLRKGYFSETLPPLSEHTFSFIHLDVDIYESYKECLQILFPRLEPGGIVTFDEYDSAKWPGAKKAIDEYFANRPEAVKKSVCREIPVWYVQKADRTSFPS